MSAKRKTTRTPTPAPTTSGLDEMLDSIRKLIAIHDAPPPPAAPVSWELPGWDPQLWPRLENRLAGIEDHLLLLTERMQQWEERPVAAVAPLRPASAPEDDGHPTSGEPLAAGDGHETHDCSGLSTASFLGNWQQQREQMLQSLSAQESVNEPGKSFGSAPALEERSTPEQREREILQDATPDELNEIQSLKEQLQQALRDTEIELSIQRAKLSQERAALEQLAANLSQREREMTRRAETPKKSGMMNRLKSFLAKNEATPGSNSEAASPPPPGPASAPRK